MLTINYGIQLFNIDVTNIAYTKLNKNNIIYIPSNDNIRANLFSDPLLGTLKSIFINNIEYDHTKNIYIDTTNNMIYTDNIPEFILSIHPPSVETKLLNVHKQLKLAFGSFNDEFPEQMMAMRYLKGNEKVLEIGGNIGRNTLVINYILNSNNNNNFVSLECDSEIALQLKYNRDINNAQFHIENSALSKRPLIQRGWDTIVSDRLLDGYKKVNTITYDELNKKYNIAFDTLVLDCEGAFYYILMDMPEILNNIKLIIMENDYHDITHKQYIDNILQQNNFYVDYSERGGWGPCYNNFFEVWKRT